jgi:GT2 family glycosyltransferase
VNNIDQVTLIIPSYNNLRHLKNCYHSIREHYPDVKLVLIDDGSNDGTYEWMYSLENKNITYLRESNRVGHTILYDKGIKYANTPIVGILHADMIVGPNYLENMLKHLKPKTVVCGTRVEPPLHPPGNEKIVLDFGLDFDILKVEDFYEWCIEYQPTQKDVTSKGMFAPWLLFKSDFEYIGGHDPGFAPFPYEDSDIFQRWMLAGYEMIQSRDAFVYHLTCRGHRWNNEIGKNDDEFVIFEQNARKYYINKWGTWIKNDDHQLPILSPVYRKQLVISHEDQLNTSGGELRNWFNYGDDIKVYIDGNTFTGNDFQYLVQLNDIIKDSGEIGTFEIGNIKIEINKIEDISKELIFIDK